MVINITKYSKYYTVVWARISFFHIIIEPFCIHSENVFPKMIMKSSKNPETFNQKQCLVKNRRNDMKWSQTECVITHRPMTLRSEKHWGKKVFKLWWVFLHSGKLKLFIWAKSHLHHNTRTQRYINTGDIISVEK